MTVIGTFLISVVQKINFSEPLEYFGGSSNVLSKAAHADLESIWHSSII